MKRHQITLAVAAAVICLTTAYARDTFEVSETDLRSFEYHDEVLLTTTKPLYRLGEILKVNDTEQYVVAINYFWDKNRWCYLVVPVKVAKKK